MTRNEQFKFMPKLINKAIENGWKEGEIYQKLYALYPANFGRNLLTDSFYRIIITNIDFCKAYFGEELTEFKMTSKCKGEGLEELINGKQKLIDAESITLTLELPKWKWHLSKMILMEDPLDYFIKFEEVDT